MLGASISYIHRTITLTKEKYAGGVPTGIAPQSYLNEAVFGYSFTEPDEPALVKVSDPAVHSFDLTDFYFGCQADTNFTYPGGSEVTLRPQACNLTVKGWAGDDTTLVPIATADIAFQPAWHDNPTLGLPYSTMTHAVLPFTFTFLRTVSFHAINASSEALSSPAVYVDNMSFNVHLDVSSNQ